MTIKAVLAVLIVSSTCKEAHSASECKVLTNSNLKYPQSPDSLLSPTWAQDQIGSQEAAEFFEYWDTGFAGLRSHWVPVGIVDDGLYQPSLKESRVAPYLFKDSCDLKTERFAGVDFHGSKVANLIVHQSKQIGTGHRAYLATACSLHPDVIEKDEDDSDIRCIQEMLLKSKRAPEIINVSAGYYDTYPGETDFVYSKYRAFAKNVPFVMGAGNYFPKLSKNALEMKGEAIVVASTAPDGSISRYSSPAQGIAIAAPSEHFLLSKSTPKTKWYQKDKLEETAFGGTSGATPLVTGALSNVISLLPGITPGELKFMLRNTATITSAFDTSVSTLEMNGTGVINALRLVRAAARVQKDWPKNRKLIFEDGTYDFSEAAKKLKDQALKLLLQKDCGSYEKAFKNLRRAFLLNPSDEDTRRVLSAFYKKEGHLMEAKFYAPLSENIKDTKLQKTIWARKITEAVIVGNVDAYRAARKQHSSDINEISRLSNLPGSDYQVPLLMDVLLANSNNTKVDLAPVFVELCKDGIKFSKTDRDKFLAEADGNTRDYFDFEKKLVKARIELMWKIIQSNCQALK